MRLEKAYFQVVGGSEKIYVLFNPASLQYSIENNQQAQGQSASNTSQPQHVTQTVGKLTMELIFDTTDLDPSTATDVRHHTRKIARLMMPAAASSNAPQQFQFVWGAFSFTGTMESYRETLDFFSDGGVPLRSTLSLGLKESVVALEAPSGGQGQGGAIGVSIGAGAAQVAASAGNPGGALSLAAANGQESLRFSSGPIAVPEGVSLQGPAGILPPSVSIGIDLPDAFSQLRQAASGSTGGSFDTRRLLPQADSQTLTTDLGAAFELGGQARQPVSVFGTRIVFD